MNLKAIMVQVLRLSKIAGTVPPHFRVVLRSSQGPETLFGTERDIRNALIQAGVSVTEVDRFLSLAKAASGDQKR